MSFYVYQYIDDSGLPYYVGKGSGNRIRANHLYTRVPSRDQRVIVKSGPTEQQAFELENQLIRQYGRKIDGGLLDNIKLNQWACATGWSHSDETKKKISIKNTGKIRTVEHKEKYSKAKQLMTDETKEKIRQANLGKVGHWAGKSMPTKGKPWTEARRDAYLKSKGVLN